MSCQAPDPFSSRPCRSPGLPAIRPGTELRARARVPGGGHPHRRPLPRAPRPRPVPHPAPHQRRSHKAAVHDDPNSAHPADPTLNPSRTYPSPTPTHVTRHSSPKGTRLPVADGGHRPSDRNHVGCRTRGAVSPSGGRLDPCDDPCPVLVGGPADVGLGAGGGVSTVRGHLTPRQLARRRPLEVRSRSHRQPPRTSPRAPARTRFHARTPCSSWTAPWSPPATTRWPSVEERPLLDESAGRHRRRHPARRHGRPPCPATATTARHGVVRRQGRRRERHGDCRRRLSRYRARFRA